MNKADNLAIFLERKDCECNGVSGNSHYFFTTAQQFCVDRLYDMFLGAGNIIISDNYTR